MNESDLLNELEREVDKEIEKVGEDSEKISPESQLFELGRLDALQHVQDWIWSLKEFESISHGKIEEKKEKDSEPKKIIEYYRDNKEMIENVKKHGEKIPRAYALSVEKLAKQYMEK